MSGVRAAMYSCIGCILHKDTCTEGVGQEETAQSKPSLCPPAMGAGAGPCPARGELCLVYTKLPCEDTRRSVHHTPHYIHWFSSLDRVSFCTHPLHSGPLPAWLRGSPGSVGAAQPLRVGDPFPFPPAPQSRLGPGREGTATAGQLPPWAFLSVLVSSLPSLNFQQFLKDMLPCSRRKEQEASTGRRSPAAASTSG